MSAARKEQRGPGIGRQALCVSRKEQRLFQELLRDHCGVSHGLGSLAFLERKLAPRLDHLGLDCLEDYYRYLKYDDPRGEELDVLVDRLTTHETYFFREEPQLALLYDQILPELSRARKGDALRVWSAGCSTGEEVYSLAILLMEHQDLVGREFEVVGTDISREVIQRARGASYGASSFRATPQHLIERYFRKNADDQLSVRSDIRNRCSFGQLNLMDVDRFGVLGNFDLVFCRNVLIYFSSEKRPKVIRAFHDSLNSGGYLCLGHSENLLNLDTRFRCVQYDRGVVYQKQGGTR